MFQLHLVTMTYGEGAGATEKAKGWLVFVKMVRVIWRELREARVEADTAYGPDNASEMLGQ